MSEQQQQSNGNGKYVGAPVERLEDARLLSGSARFADHYPAPTGTLHAAILRSPHAHAEIAAIDTSEALAQPGVAAVLSGADIKAVTEPYLVIVKKPLDEWPLAVDRVRYTGQAVALVLADDRYRAEDALAHIAVRYNPLEPVIDPEQAAADGAPLIHPAAETNLVSERNFRYGDPETAFAEADRTISVRIDYPRNSLTPIEGFVVLAEYLKDDDMFDILSNFQGP